MKWWGSRKVSGLPGSTVSIHNAVKSSIGTSPWLPVRALKTYADVLGVPSRTDTSANPLYAFSSISDAQSDGQSEAVSLVSVDSLPFPREHRNIPTFKIPTSLAPMCRWRSRPQHQQRKGTLLSWLNCANSEEASHGRASLRIYPSGGS